MENDYYEVSPVISVFSPPVKPSLLEQSASDADVFGKLII